MPAPAAALVATLVCAVASAAADELVLAPVADASIYGGPGLDNTADGAGPHLWSSNTAGGFTRRTLLRFDLGGVPAGAVVRGVQLTLVQSRTLAAHQVRLHRVLASWSEGPANAGSSGSGAQAQAGDVTWLRRVHPSLSWTAPGGDYAAAASAARLVGTDPVPYTWGSTPGLVADVQGWLADPASNHGWILIGDEVGDRQGKRFESRENVTAANRPRLVVVYDPPLPVAAATGDVPLPPWALALFGLGLAGLVMRRRTA
jgi:MYXO-CTERM domain-containing protein